MLKILTVVVVLLFLVCSSLQTDLYISSTGTDYGNCTVDACATVEYAISQLPNETSSVDLFFSEGIYNESFTCAYSWCSIKGNGTNSTIFDLRSAIYLGENATIENISVIGLNDTTAIVFDFAKNQTYTTSNWVVQNVVFTDISIFTIVNISNSYFSQNLKFGNVLMENVRCSSFCISSIVLYGRQNIYLSNLLARDVTAAAGSFYASSAVPDTSVDLDCDNVTVVYSKSLYGLYSWSTSGGLMNSTMRNCNYSYNNFSAGSVFAMQIQYRVPNAEIYLNNINSYVCFNYQYSFASLDKGGQSHFYVTNGTFDQKNTYASTADTKFINAAPCVPVVTTVSNVASSSPPSSNNNTTGIIVGAVVGGVVVLAIVAFIIIFLVYRRNQINKRKDLELQQKDDAAAEPEDIPKYKIVTDVAIGKRLGGGSFGDVFLGSWNGAKVACKKPKNEDALKEFMKEATTLEDIQHPNCVQFMGIYTHSTGDKYMVFEFLSRGDLVNVLKEEARTLSTNDLLDMCEGMCKGLVYLEARSIMHRDVALRNLLVTVQDGQYLVKVSDFGLSREGGEYSPTSETKLAIKWTAPEVILGGKITMKNDVWAFGITCWEIFSFGREKPYSELTNKQASAEIPKGRQLPQPEKCPDSFYNEVMKKCWQLNPDDRPTFKDLSEILRNLRKQEAFSRAESAMEEETKAEKEQITKEQEKAHQKEKQKMNIKEEESYQDSGDVVEENAVTENDPEKEDQSEKKKKKKKRSREKKEKKAKELSDQQRG